MSQNLKVWHYDIWKCHKMSLFFECLVQIYVTVHVWILLGTALIHMCDTTHPCKDQVAPAIAAFWYWFICVTWLIYWCNVTRWFVWYDSFVCVTWLIHTCDVTHSYEYNMTDSYVWRDSFIRVASGSCYRSLLVLIHMCDIILLYVWRGSFKIWHDSFIRVTWINHICDMTHWY